MFHRMVPPKEPHEEEKRRILTFPPNCIHPCINVQITKSTLNPPFHHHPFIFPILPKEKVTKEKPLSCMQIRLESFWYPVMKSKERKTSRQAKNPKQIKSSLNPDCSSRQEGRVEAESRVGCVDSDRDWYERSRKCRGEA